MAANILDLEVLKKDLPLNEKITCNTFFFFFFVYHILLIVFIVSYPSEFYYFWINGGC